ncbi:hypothetical protein CspHIS471_0209640 [Cutaneotrichosporon sp. HIS471]|nr:hypothetical protein CspHIS471_0209640 [Cutaneotrichosporon sp. HIS471]
MPDWDSIPSRPLPFAATLHALDLNAPSTPRLPRPVRCDYEELPKIFPSPPYSNARQGNQSTSISSGAVPEFSPSRTLPRGRPGSDEWMESMVANCVDNAKCDLNLSSGFGLESVSSNIRDLRDLVTLSTKSPAQSPGPGSPWASRSSLAATPEQQPSQLLRLGERSFTRTQSAPASAAFFSRMNGINEPGFDSSRGSLHPAPHIRQGLSVRQNSSTSRPFTRSKTGAMSLTRTQPNIGVFLSQNRLTTLPTALFEIRNLTVLSLRM